ncbi:MAG: hypothetical protein ABFS28_05685 [Bacteroidota bacterium]
MKTAGDSYVMTESKKNILNLIFLLLFFLLQGKLSGQSFFASLSAVGETEICQGDSVAARIRFWGGTAPFTVVINDTDGEFMVLESIESKEIFYLKPLKSNRFYMASVVDSKGRKGSPYGSITVEVYESTQVSINIDRTAFMETEDGFPLTSSPSGGSFSGPGVSGSTFYPAVATSQGSPHRITCTYENQNDCITRDQINLYVLSGVSSVNLYLDDEIISTVCDNGSTYTIKGSNEDGLSGTFELFRQGSSSAIPGHITDNDPGDNQAVLSLIGLTGAYEIVYTYGVEDIEIKATTEINIYELGVQGILNLPDTICKNDRTYPLVPEVSIDDPDATYSFSGPGVSGSQADGFYLDPSHPDVPVGQNEIVLDYTSSDGCRIRISQMIQVGLVPLVSFAPDLICIEAGGSMVSFTNLTSSKESVAEWSWDFGDPASGAANFSKLEDPEHFYSEPGARTIILSGLSYDGCRSELSLDTVLADKPAVDFNWDNDCSTDMHGISFHGSPLSVHSALSSLSWIFSTTGGEVLDVIEREPSELSVDYSFPSMAEYDISFIVQNEAGCQGELTRRIELIPVQVVSEDGYMESFEDMAEGWKVKSENQASSWILGVPDFTGFEQIENDLAWYTDLPDQQDYLEHSWINTPCFDLSALARPVIQMDLMKSFTPGMDGAVLQYMDWERLAWTTLGTMGGGLNWYNDSAILYMPGGSSTGWGLTSFVPDSEWVNAKYSLSGLSGNSYLKFRIAVATGGSQEISGGLNNQGFAFDNFFIGEANQRRSVLEYFTNSSGGFMPDADAMVNSLSSKYGELVYDLHYHMNIPEYDPMNANNPLPPSTRAFNYGVPVVPYAVLNGGTSPEYRYDFTPPSGEISEDVLIGSSLEAPLFEVFLSVEYMDNHLEGTATVVCVDDRFDSYLQLYLVVIEKEVTSYHWLRQDSTFRNVVLDMLPSPAGKLIGNNWRSGKVSALEFSWDYVEYIEDIKDLSVVAFVQDRESGSILQATDMPNTLGVHAPGKKHVYESLVLYPNPAESFTSIKFGDRTGHPGQLILVDISGQEVMRIPVQQGTVVQKLDLINLPQGLFMVFWKEAGIVKGQAKLIHHR